MPGFETQQIRLNSASQAVTVPDDCRARLMYYLEVLTGILEMKKSDSGLLRFCDYNNYDDIESIADKKTLLQLGELLSPDLLIDKCMFNDENIRAGNKIYNLSLVRNTYAFSNNIMINGRQTQVTSILLYKKVWLQRNYYDAMAELKADIEARVRMAALLGLMVLGAANSDSDSDDDGDNNCVIS